MAALTLRQQEVGVVYPAVPELSDLERVGEYRMSLTHTALETLLPKWKKAHWQINCDESHGPPLHETHSRIRPGLAWVLTVANFGRSVCW